EAGALVEPLGGEHLGGAALGLATAGEPDAHAREGLRGFRQRDHAEAKRHAQAHVALEAVHGQELKARRVHQSMASTPGALKISRVRSVYSPKRGGSLSRRGGRGRSMSRVSTMRPGRGLMTTTRSARRTASGMLWVMWSAVLRVSIHTRWMSIESC